MNFIHNDANNDVGDDVGDNILEANMSYFICLYQLKW